jgi:sulfite reductase (NADPH) flavoprotein alpha-component
MQRDVRTRAAAPRPQVCGDAGSMAGQVEEALLGIIEQHQGQGAAAARQYLDQLSQSERYQRDVWFS